MTSNQFILLFVVFCGIALHTVFGQMGVFNSYSSNSAGVDNPVVQTPENPNTVDPDVENPDVDDGDDDAMTRAGRVESIEEFLALLTRDGQQITLDEVNEDQVDADGKLSINSGGRLAVPDNCSPRNTTVRITMDEETDSDTAFFPRCTKIERCGGCCSSPNLECVPSYTERVVLKVLKGRVPYPGAPHLEYTGFASKIEERHMTCRVTCKLNAQSCGPKKNFSRRKCNCRCKVTLPCPPPTIWDAEDCSCKCPSVTECCATPNCGMVWSSTLCECVLSNDGRVVISANDGNERNLTMYNNNNNNNNNNDNVPPTAERTTTTTTTTTTPSTTTSTTSATTTPNPCDEINCPPRFTKVRFGDQCRCQFSGRRRGRGRG